MTITALVVDARRVRLHLESVVTNRLPCTIAIAVLACAAGCIPGAVRATLSPHMVGVYTREDGNSVPGTRMLLSTASGDSTCTRPTSLATTDAAGRFEFAATTRREPLILMPLDRMRCFYVCGDSGGTPLAAYEECVGAETPPSVLIQCVATHQILDRNRPRIACRARPRTYSGAHPGHGEQRQPIRQIGVASLRDRSSPVTRLSAGNSAARSGAPEIQQHVSFGG